jgi:hypothetical protein
VPAIVVIIVRVALAPRLIALARIARPALGDALIVGTPLGGSMLLGATLILTLLGGTAFIGTMLRRAPLFHAPRIRTMLCRASRFIASRFRASRFIAAQSRSMLLHARHLGATGLGVARIIPDIGRSAMDAIVAQLPRLVVEDDPAAVRAVIPAPIDEVCRLAPVIRARIILDAIGRRVHVLGVVIVYERAASVRHAARHESS